jgi:hypothetical protein
LHDCLSAPAVGAEERKYDSIQRDRLLLALIGINQEVKAELLNLNHKFSHLNLLFGDESEQL